MSFDVVWFGYGAGLVMVGWFAGMVISMFFSAVNGVR
jgi:hypothetical protein